MPCPSGVKLRVAIASVVRYNDLCASGRDDDFGKDSKMLLPLTQPPYFLQTHPYQGPGSMLVTAGGLMTDEYQNVLDADLEPIPGLYATGNCCGSRFGTQYTTPISGVSIGIALTLDWLCGQDAVSCDGSQSY